MAVQITVYREFYTEEIIDKTVINNIRIQQHIITVEYQNEEGALAYPAHSWLINEFYTII